MAEEEKEGGAEEEGDPAEAAARDLERIRGDAGKQEGEEEGEEREEGKAEDREPRRVPPSTEPAPHPRKPLLPRAAAALSATRRVLSVLWLMALTLFLVRSVWTTLSGAQISGEFEVPSAPAAQGYTGSVAKDLLTEKVRAILASAPQAGRPDSESEEALFLDEGSDDELSDLKIPGAEVSVQKVVALALAAVGPRER